VISALDMFLVTDVLLRYRRLNKESFSLLSKELQPWIHHSQEWEPHLWTTNSLFYMCVFLLWFSQSTSNAFSTFFCRSHKLWWSQNFLLDMKKHF